MQGGWEDGVVGSGRRGGGERGGGGVALTVLKLHLGARLMFVGDGSAILLWRLEMVNSIACGQLLTWRSLGRCTRVSSSGSRGRALESAQYCCRRL